MNKRTLSIRRPLQQQLFAAWRYSIEQDYRNQRINSERSLQASLWAQLNHILPPKQRRMFIEPKLAFTENGTRRRLYPDIVICNTQTVIAVVELKYQPRVNPSFAKDLESLRSISRHRDQLTVENSRFRGTKRDPRTYAFADSMLFVWAGVHQRTTPSYATQDVPLLADGIPELEHCFMELHAETDERNAPHVFARP